MSAMKHESDRRVGGWRIAIAMLCFAWIAAAFAGTARGEESPKAAVFDFELIDTSLEGEMRGPQDTETARLALISDYLREKLAESGKYIIVDIAPAAATIQDTGYINTCNGCDADIARSLGANIAITGTVLKISTLILYVTVNIRDAATGKKTAEWSVSIRGNTDKSWIRGVRYIVKNQMLAE